jgi:hypothetical protein
MSFPPNSRYADTPEATYVTADGRVITYVSERLMPPPELFVPLALHRLIAAERVDLLADRYYSDPEQYWRICDANRTFWPPDATAEANSQVVIPLPLEVSSRGRS